MREARGCENLDLVCDGCRLDITENTEGVRHSEEGREAAGGREFLDWGERLRGGEIAEGVRVVPEGVRTAPGGTRNIFCHSLSVEEVLQSLFSRFQRG